MTIEHEFFGIEANFFLLDFMSTYSHELINQDEI